MVITLVFQLQQDTLPSLDEHVGDLWKVATLLDLFGFPIDDWCPPAATPKKSLESPAFDRNGPTSVAREKFRVQDEKDATTDFHFRRTGVWTKDRGGVFSVLLSSDVDNPICLVKLQFDEVTALNDARNMQRLVLGLLDIWPSAANIRVGPLMYYTLHQVFPKRPGAGWMLYLAKVITISELPEAAQLVPVMEGDTQRGTIIVSVANEVFSVDNPEHVKIANSIEVRLADQDLLPRQSHEPRGAAEDEGKSLADSDPRLRPKRTRVRRSAHSNS